MLQLTPALSRAAEDFSVAAIVDELGEREFLSFLVVNKFRVHRRRFSSRHNYNTIHTTTRHSALLVTGRLATCGCWLDRRGPCRATGSGGGRAGAGPRSARLFYPPPRRPLVVSERGPAPAIELGAGVEVSDYACRRSGNLLTL